MRITMEELVQALGLASVINKNEVNIECPVCKRDTLNINFRKQVFACPACGEAEGGVIDAWALFRGIQSISSRERRRLAKIDLEEYFKGGSEKPKKRSAAKKAETKTEIKIAPPCNLDKAYRRLFEVSALFQKHLKQLLDRGLDTDQIKGGMYVSSMRFTDDEMEEYFCDIDLRGVPGFYQENGLWKFVFYGEGILVPVFSVDGLIVAIQIRRDSGKNKYLYISSCKEGGAKARSYPSFVNRKEISCETIILTEGPLKGSIIDFLSEYPVIAIPGVNSQKYLIGELLKLKEKGLKKIVICYDMDYKTKPAVQKGLLKLRKRLSDLEIPFVQRTWDSEYKGYDDYLAAKKNNQASI